MSGGKLVEDWGDRQPQTVVFTDGEMIRRIKRLEQEQQERQRADSPQPADKTDAGA